MLLGKTGHIFWDQHAVFTINSEFDWKIADLIAIKEKFNENVEK